MKKLRIALIGCGRISACYANAFPKLSDIAEFVCAIDTDIEKARAFAAPFGSAYGTGFEELQEKGIDTARILPEDKSQTTGQNITNSKKLMKEGASVGIVTNNFHVFRALQIAKKYGLSDVCGIAADSTPKYLPNNMLREFFAEMKWLL